MALQNIDAGRFSARSNGEAVVVGVFAGPISGLRYETPSLTGFTNPRGEFQYRAGETVTFRIGRLVLGAAVGAATLNLAQLVDRVDGKIDRVRDPHATNLARLVQTLNQSGDLETGVSIAAVIHDLIPSSFVNFGLPEIAFGDDPVVLTLLETLNAAPGVFTANTPRRLRDPAAARNELRRNIRGIIKHTDVRIPMRDGSYVCADVFRPAGAGPHPVIMSKGFYGKSFYHECICSEDDAREKEEMEDRYFSGNPDGLQYENHEAVDSSVWVPEGYVCIRVDARGVCHSPGVQQPFSVQEAEDYYDAIEWAGTQSWSNGNVGLWGMSYLAMAQHSVASLQPPHLKAMVAQGTDADIYNEAVYVGGILGSGFWNWWHRIWSGKNHCGERRETDWMARVLKTPFNDPDAYGAKGSIFMSPDLSTATAPVWVVGPQTGVTIHQLGSSETFIHSTASKHRRFDFTDAWFPGSYKRSTVADHLRWFDHWLKGIENGVADEPPVRVQVRTGNAAHYVIEAAEWPLPETTYRRWHLDATATAWKGDERGTDFLSITETPPLVHGSASYDAHLDIGTPTLIPTGSADGAPRWSTGVSFVSEPLTEDLVVAGYMKVGLWVSSTSRDMDVFVSLRVLDEQGREIRYESVVLPIDPVHPHPVGHGLLKVSHRKLDEARTSDYWPVPSHLEADHAPLEPDQIVPIEVGLYPSTAAIRRGCRLRIDVQPYSPAGLPTRAYDESYHVGATNTVFTGPDHPSYIQLPIIPASAGEAD